MPGGGVTFGFADSTSYAKGGEQMLGWIGHNWQVVDSEDAQTTLGATFGMGTLDEPLQKITLQKGECTSGNLTYRELNTVSTPRLAHDNAAGDDVVWYSYGKVPEDATQYGAPRGTPPARSVERAEEYLAG